MTTTTDRAALIAQIAALPEQLAAAVGDVSAEQLTTPYLAGEWTVAQNVHHVADSHLNAYVRCKLIATEEQPTFKPYDQDAWALLPDSQRPDVSVSLALLHSLHTRWVDFWQQLASTDWERVGLHPEIGAVTLDEQLKLYAAHGQAHLDQIARALKEG